MTRADDWGVLTVGPGADALTILAPPRAMTIADATPVPVSSGQSGQTNVEGRTGTVTATDDVLVAAVADPAAMDRALQVISDLENTAAGAPRWIVLAATEVAPLLLPHGVRLRRTWDLSEVHRLLAGGSSASLPSMWSRAMGLDAASAPRPIGDDLFDFVSTDPAPHEADSVAASSVVMSSALHDSPATPAPQGDAGQGQSSGWAVRPDGHLRPEVAARRWPLNPHDTDAAREWVALIRRLAQAQLDELESGDQPRATAQVRVHTAYSESAAALLATELATDGLPIDRRALTELIAQHDTPDRDAVVLAKVPGAEHVDLRNPAQVKAMLATLGLNVPDTRKHTLHTYADAHPVIPALLTWRVSERIATTYGYRWMDEHIGPDDRLRGSWQASDGAAGRMTAGSGLHNLPAGLRTAVAAPPGRVLVRADLGQIEPRVLAAVSRDAAFAAAATEEDLYAPVASALGVERAAAKVALLSAMYGGTAGNAREALERLERTYPVALGYLTRAYDDGVAGRDVFTHGGRRVRTRGGENAAGRGRFARNAVIQGSAAELFKAWAATVRLALPQLGGRIVLCLHDELLVEIDQQRAQAACTLLIEALESSARRYTGTNRVRFVADVTIVQRWSDAKG